MSNRPRNRPEQPGRPLTRRQVSYQQREANLQRRLVLGIGGVLALALLLIIGGIVYDQFVVPSRDIVSVNGQTLTRAQYERIAREATIQQIAQNAQLSKAFGPNMNFGEGQGTFSQQVVELNQQLAQIGTIRGRRQPVDDQTVSQWIDRQLIEQGAKTQFQIDPSQGEVDQALVERLASMLETPEVVTDTAELTSTATLTGTVGATTTSEENGTATSTEAQAGATAAASAAEPTADAASTPEASPTPSPSPLPEEATSKADQILTIIYDEYQAILNDLDPAAAREVRTPHASRDELAAALRNQFRQSLIEERVKEKLVATVDESDTTEPEQVSARHILLKVPRPTPTPTPTASPEATAGAETTATSGADAAATSTAVPETPTAAPSPTPTLTPEELDSLFEERKAEADAIYEQVTENPDSFADVARERSEDEASAPQGGDLGTFGRGQMVAAFEEAVFALAENEISEPVRSEFGWHIIQRLPEDPQAKLERQRETAFTEWTEELRKNATIVPAPTPTPTEVPLPTPIETETAPAAGTEAAPEETSGAETATTATANGETEAAPSTLAPTTTEPDASTATSATSTP